jgi:gluconate 2-dehydrogenase gamma chain
MASFLSRREMLKRAAAAGMTSAVPAQALAQVLPERARDQFENLSNTESEILEAVVSRLIPTDGNGPGALEAGAANYIDKGLANALSESHAAYSVGLAALDSYADQVTGRGFVSLEPGEQDSLLEDLEQNRAVGFGADSATFFNLMLRHTIEGTFSDPAYGGNQDFIGWEMIGYPGIRLGVTVEQQQMDYFPEMTRVSAHDLPMFDINILEEGGNDD